MKYNTIKGYLGGGYVSPMGYQSGGYIPGVSQAKYGIGLQRDITQAQKEFEEQARKVEKEQKKRGLFSTLGSYAGTALGAALAPATGGLSLVAAKGLGSALGYGAGEMAAGKMYDAGQVNKSSTGLFGEDFSDLNKMEREMGEGALGRSLGTGAATALTAGIGELGKVGAGGLYGKAMNKLRFGTPDMAGKVVDSAGNLTSIPGVADTSIMDKYFESILPPMPVVGKQVGGNVDILEHTANIRKKIADSPIGGEDKPTDVGSQFVGPLLPEDAKWRDQMRTIAEMSEGIPQLDIRRDYGADRRSSARVRQDNLMAQLDREKAMRTDEDFQDVRPDDMTSLLNLQTPQQPSAFEREMAGSYEQSLPRAGSLGMDNELLSMAQDSLSTQKRMENLSRGLDRYIGKAEGRYHLGQAIPDQSILSDIKRPQQGDINFGQNIESVQAPSSLIGEEYAMARDSLNTQRRMEDLSRNLGVNIATAEGRMGQTIPNQEIRRDMQEDNLYNTQVQMPYYRLPMYKHGGEVGAYKGGRGLLSMAPFSRRII